MRVTRRGAISIPIKENRRLRKRKGEKEVDEEFIGGTSEEEEVEDLEEKESDQQEVDEHEEEEINENEQADIEDEFEDEENLSNDNLQSTAQLFSSQKFFIVQFHPDKNNLSEKIQKLGGIIVDKSKLATIKIGFKNAIGEFVSSDYIVDCIKENAILTPTPYLMRSVKTGRNEFTQQEIKLLRDYLTKSDDLYGNRVYIDFASRNPSHSWQSWREHGINSLAPTIMSQRKNPTCEECQENGLTCDGEESPQDFPRCSNCDSTGKKCSLQDDKSKKGKSISPSVSKRTPNKQISVSPSKPSPNSIPETQQTTSPTNHSPKLNPPAAKKIPSPLKPILKVSSNPQLHHTPARSKAINIQYVSPEDPAKSYSYSTPQGLERLHVYHSGPTSNHKSEKITTSSPPQFHGELDNSDIEFESQIKSVRRRPNKRPRITDLLYTTPKKESPKELKKDKRESSEVPNFIDVLSQEFPDKDQDDIITAYEMGSGYLWMVRKILEHNFDDSVKYMFTAKQDSLVLSKNQNHVNQIVELKGKKLVEIRFEYLMKIAQAENNFFNSH